VTTQTFPRAAGVLLPLASVPARHGIGDLGPDAARLLRWLGDAGMTWWQMLPVGPIGGFDSPYDSSSAFAGEALYLSLDALAEDGLLEPRDVRAPQALSQGSVRYDEARSFKLPRLQLAFERWRDGGGAKAPAFRRFCREQRFWLDDWACFGREDADEQLRERFLQWKFSTQWSALRAQAAESGVRLMGDIPIFVSPRSVEVVARPELFRLDRRGRPKVVTGVPPDEFSADGQHWGHPHYDWGAHRREGFAWWRARVQRQLSLFDTVRIDHFIGFHHCWEIPARAKSAIAGRYVSTPGRELLEALRASIIDSGHRGSLPLIAEDLGALTPEVTSLRDEFELPGMRVLQWGFGHNAYYAPHRVPEQSIVYPGTHDNDTVQGWWRTLPAETKRRVKTRTGGTASEIAWSIWREACGTAAHTAIVQLQDLLELGSSSRMNTPGTTRSNWSWRPARAALTRPLARRSRELLEATDRLPGSGSTGATTRASGASSSRKTRASRPARGARKSSSKSRSRSRKPPGGA